jgi:hypothetical protein
VGGWVTIDNRSGKKYDNAKLKLIAGDVNTVQTPRYQYIAMKMATPMRDGAAAPGFS